MYALESGALQRPPQPRPVPPADVVNRCAILIPAWNEQATVAEVVRRAGALPQCDVIVVDDASTDNTAREALTAGAAVLPLPLQLGAWGATQTGIRYALRRGYRSVVTMDADGQHDAADVRALRGALAAGRADVIIGSFPQRSSRARRFACGYFRLLAGIRLVDITSGFRAYNHAAMTLLASADASLVDYQDVGILLLLRRGGLRAIEVPVAMERRRNGKSRIFSSWLVVARYMLQTSLLCIARLDLRGAARPTTANDG